MMNNISLEDIKYVVNHALGMFYQLDSELLNYKTEEAAVSERCIVFRIGWYIQSMLRVDEKYSEFSVDSEYNRCFDHPKRMYMKTLEGIKIKNAIPDLIIHQRKSNRNNLAVFEFKKAGIYAEAGCADDYKKLMYFTDPNNEYKFKFGFWIVLHKNAADVHIFQSGKEKSHLYYIWKAEK